MTTTITITTGGLKRLLDPPLKTVGKDDGLPVLAHVHLRGIGGTLVASSTDRFRMTLHRMKLADDAYSGDDFQIMLPADALKGLLGVFKSTARTAHLNLRLDIKDGPRTAGRTGLAMTVTDYESTMTIRGGDGEYPRLGSLLDGAMKETGPVGTFGVNPAFLKDIAGMGGRADSIRVRAPHGTDGKPIVFEVTPDLIVLLMPRRIVGGEPVPPIDITSWTDLLGAKK